MASTVAVTEIGTGRSLSGPSPCTKSTSGFAAGAKSMTRTTPESTLAATNAYTFSRFSSANE
ncbi:hypothetical protein BCEN4_10012 [Burkholderia cenocepacia]|nr:hypothetical protein BCEN4_10012 [Burkholderia cenocepacia]